MKLTTTDIEMTADEIAQIPELQDLIRRLGGPAGPPPTREPRTVGSDPDTPAQGADQITEFIRLRGRANPNVDLVEEFVRRVIGFGDVEAFLGTSKNTPDGLNRYLMLKHMNHRYGAISYVHPSNGSINHRLERSRSAGRRYSEAINSKDAYQVRTFLTERAAVDEAVALAEEAYRIVRS
ncbi:MAG: hypothetical protein ACR2JP_03015 [Acidimicrobiia bacterium]